MVDMNGRTVIVTGAASGIGLATARLLASQGADLVLWDVNEAELVKVGETLGAITAVVDISDSQQIQTALSQVEKVDVVIHSAGIIYTGLVEEIPIEKQQQLVQVNLTGSLNVAYSVIPQLKKSQGSLVMMSSTSAFYGPPEFATYGATKAGVLSLAQALRVELELAGVHVGVACPFFVQTPMIDEGEKTKLYGRFGVAHTPEEVAQAIVKGIHKRKFMIWPSPNPAFFNWLSHYGYPLSHRFMRWFWR